MSLENIYLRMPIVIQNLGCTLEGLRIQQKRYGGGFRRRLEQAEARENWSEQQVLEYRDQRIREFVAHCASKIPYYRRQFRQLGVSPNDIRTIEDLHLLPILTKSEVQEHPSEFVSDEVSQYGCDSVHTSGTTGGGLQFLMTHQALEEQWAVWWRYRRWHGIQLDTWCAYFGGRSLVPVQQSRPPFWRTNYAGRQLFFSAYHLTPDNLRGYAEKLRSARIPWLHGYPSLLSLIAAYILDTGFDLGYQPKWITTGAENLLPQQTSVIQKGFGVRPVQHYGMAEAVANISECRQGSLHVDEDFAGVEFVQDESGQTRVIGTNFSNLATPLLRYDAQDIVCVTGRTCGCGRRGRIVDAIDGRLEDYVVLKNGAKLGRLDHVFKDMVHIREAQIVQRASGMLDILIVKGQSFEQSDEQRLRQEFTQRVGDDTELKIEYVDELRRTSAGKLRFVVSELKGSRVEAVAGGKVAS
jgi:phenylacetate-CoA ligase